MERIAVLGAGGHAKVVVDALLSIGCFEIVGLVVADTEAAEGLLGIGVVGDHAVLPALLASGVTALAMGVGSIGDVSAREQLFESCLRDGFSFPAIVHPAASVSAHAEVGDGAYVGPHATVCAGARLGFGCIVNSGSVVDHDCTVGDFAHVAPGAALSGNVAVGRGAHIGTGAAVAHGISIGAGALIGAGAAVVDDVPERVVAFGVPCRVVRDRD
jgi:sugar O-acyltransferase (sialic acid O-acetyltransferase NeuD family)